jgi:hypothetical protein
MEPLQQRALGPWAVSCARSGSEPHFVLLQTSDEFGPLSSRLPQVLCFWLDELGIAC